MISCSTQCTSYTLRSKRIRLWMGKTARTHCSSHAVMLTAWQYAEVEACSMGKGASTVHQQPGIAGWKVVSTPNTVCRTLLLCTARCIMHMCSRLAQPIAGLQQLMTAFKMGVQDAAGGYPDDPQCNWRKAYMYRCGTIEVPLSLGSQPVAIPAVLAEYRAATWASPILRGW
jgi:hypothetical protein